MPIPDYFRMGWISNDYSYDRPPSLLLNSLPEFTRQFYAGEKVKRHNVVRCLGGAEEATIGCPECDSQLFEVWKKNAPHHPIVVRRRSVDLNGFGAIDVFWSACANCGFYFWSCPALDMLTHEMQSAIVRKENEIEMYKAWEKNGAAKSHIDLMMESQWKMPKQQAIEMTEAQLADISRILRGNDGQVVSVHDVNAVPIIVTDEFDSRGFKL